MSYHGTHVVVMEVPEGSWALRHTAWALQAPFYLIRFSVGYFALAQGIRGGYRPRLWLRKTS
jgi:hypothetical protein